MGSWQSLGRRWLRSASVKNDTDHSTGGSAKEHVHTSRPDSRFKVVNAVVDGRIKEVIEDVADSNADQRAWNDSTPSQEKPNRPDDPKGYVHWPPVKYVKATAKCGGHASG